MDLLPEVSRFKLLQCSLDSLNEPEFAATTYPNTMP